MARPISAERWSMGLAARLQAREKPEVPVTESAPKADIPQPLHLNQAERWAVLREAIKLDEKERADFMGKSILGENWGPTSYDSPYGISSPSGAASEFQDLIHKTRDHLNKSSDCMSSHCYHADRAKTHTASAEQAKGTGDVPLAGMHTKAAKHHDDLGGIYAGLADTHFSHAMGSKPK